MAWTYSGDPGSSPRDQVRFLIGDTDPLVPMLTDEEIDWLVTTSSSVYFAAAQAAESVAAKYGKYVTKTVDGLSITKSERSINYAALAKRLRSMARTRGGFLVSYGSTRDGNIFTLGMHDYRAVDERTALRG
jgi:hypothetical protein